MSLKHRYSHVPARRVRNPTYHTGSFPASMRSGVKVVPLKGQGGVAVISIHTNTTNGIFPTRGQGLHTVARPRAHLRSTLRVHTCKGAWSITGRMGCTCRLRHGGGERQAGTGLQRQRTARAQIRGCEHLLTSPSCWRPHAHETRREALASGTASAPRTVHSRINGHLCSPILEMSHAVAAGAGV